MKTKTFWILTPIALALIILCVRLGLWQLDRGEQKQHIITLYTDNQTAPPLTLAELTPNISTLRYRRLTVQGRFDNNNTFFLDNRFEDHQLGYEVITPFILVSDADHALLINRGWVPRGVQRDDIPDIPDIDGVVTITTLIDTPSFGLLLGQNFEAHTQGTIIQTLDYSAIEQRLNYHLYPFIGLLDNIPAYGFSQHWTPNLGISPARHHGYAVQWFALAITGLFIYGLLTYMAWTKRNRKKNL